MIIGMTTAQRRAKRHLKIVERAIGKYRFAWWPINDVNGRTIWMQKYYEVCEEWISLNENNEYRIEQYYGNSRYAYANVSDAQWTMFERQRPRYSEYKAVKGGHEVLGKLMYIKEELLAIINS